MGGSEPVTKTVKLLNRFTFLSSILLCYVCVVG